jgi:NodT family efflux transporter outer membrane factor (OMF) lipoprotein
MRTRNLGGLGLTLGLGVRAGCDLAPPEETPVAAAPAAAWREAGAWTPAAPADAAPRGRWWTIIPDPELDTLESRVEADSPRLAAAVARYDQARALAARARADLTPTVILGATADRSFAPDMIQHGLAAGASAAYEVDLWGRVRNSVAAARDEAQASAGDLASIRLSLQAELADDYIRLRGADADIDVLQKGVHAFGQAVELTQHRFDGGASSESDLARAKTQLEAAQAQLALSIANRALLEHAIAILVGDQPSTFALAAQPEPAAAPVAPVDAPSTLLQRRPDVAAAERRVAEANAQIGVSRAAFYPTLTLGGSGGYETSGPFAGAGSDYWAIGPASVSLPIYDGGRRRADLARVRAVFAEAAADYRQTVLAAFRQVEDELALVNRLAGAEDRQQAAVAAATRADRLATIRYTEGAADYLEVVTAQTAELDARRTGVDIRTQRLIASIDLVRFLGGGWRPGPETGAPSATSTVAAKGR